MTDALRKAKAAERKAIADYRHWQSLAYRALSRAEFADGLRAKQPDADGELYKRSLELWSIYDTTANGREKAFKSVLKRVRLTERAKEGR